MTVYEAFAGTSAASTTGTAATAAVKSRPHQVSWRRWYLHCAVLADVAVTAAAATVAATVTGAPAIALLVVVAWPLLCLGARAYAAAALSHPGAETKAVLGAALAALAGLGAYVSLVGRPLAPDVVVLALPLLVGGSLLARALLRSLLSRHAATGHLSRRVVLVGDEEGVRQAASRLSRTQGLGKLAAGIVAEREGESLSLAADVPVLRGLDRVPSAVDLLQADTVLVAAGSLTSAQLRSLSWSLEGRDVELAVLPGVHDIDAHRLSVTVLDGLPVLGIATPRRSGIAMRVKHAIDRLVAALLLLAAAPVLMVIAAAVRLSSPGPAVFRQLRVGREGRTFTLYKFRTMVTDAEAQREILLAGNEADGPLFKIREDPRVTKVGRILRKHSLDELPQLLNVLLGHMSLVGPRPPLPVEVAAYSSEVRRRLLVRPGLTGLWQVSGRSDLSWEDSVRLDLRYVDNVSLVGDADILRRTVRTVISGGGAY